jgi:hypothetical protein
MVGYLSAFFSAEFQNHPSLIPRSLASDVQIHFLYLTSHTALLFVIFFTFCLFNSIVTYDQSKRGINVGALDRRWFYVASQNVHSIVIVIPLHVSKCSRVLKKLTASPWANLYFTHSGWRMVTFNPEFQVWNVIFLCKFE